MSRLLLLILLLAPPAWANRLTLEFAQEGDPGQPRALIVIHNVFESREDFKSLFAAWAIGSWGRDQYCSVFAYEYDGNALKNLTSWETLGQDLLRRIQGNDFEVPRFPDSINPNGRGTPTDARQPAPRLNSDDLEILLVGYGYGGLVARQAAQLAKREGLKVTRIACVGTPLDGVSTLNLVLGLTTQRARSLGLQSPVTNLDLLSPAWWTLTHLYDESRKWPEIFAPALRDVQIVAAYGGVKPAHLPTDNVLYGRYLPVAYESENGSDGFLPQPLAWGRKTGPISFVKEAELELINHAVLTESASTFVLKEALQLDLVYSYLARRQGIEEFVRGKVGEPPLYQYWDEREGEGLQAQYRGAYASRKGLYEMMWGLAP